jgi:hypothetical protein
MLRKVVLEGLERDIASIPIPDVIAGGPRSLLSGCGLMKPWVARLGLRWTFLTSFM